MADIPLSRQRALLGDFSAALGQQMFFWGRDVLTDGNLLIRYGFKKLPSPGLQGTSCYRKRWDCGCLELHGACAGWYPRDVEHAPPGFLYVRTLARCAAHHESEPVIPGEHGCFSIDPETRATMAASQRFASWLVDYEGWVQRRKGQSYRNMCREMLARLPKGRPWLPPLMALRWVRLFAEQGASAPRARDFS